MDAFAARTLRELSRVVFTRIGLVAAIAAIITGVTWLGCAYVWTPIYRSNVSLIFKQPMPRNPLTRDSPERTLEVFVKAQQQIVISQLVVARTHIVSETPEWRREWYALRGLPSDRQYAAARLFVQKISPEVSRWMQTHQDDMARFRKSIDFETPGGEQVAMSESFTIRVDRPGPRDVPDSHLAAKHAADVLADMYLYRYRELQEDLNDPARSFIEKRVQDYYDSEVLRAENALRAFVDALPQPGDVAILEQLLKSGTEHGDQITATTARNELLRLDRRLAELRALRDGILAQVPEAARPPQSPEALNGEQMRALTIAVPQQLLEMHVVVHELARKIGDLRGRQRRLEVRYTDANRELRDVLEEIDRSNRQMLREMITAAEAARVEIDTVDAQRKQIAADLDTYVARLNHVSRLLPEYQRLKNDVAITHGQYETLRRELADAQTGQAQTRSAITVGLLDEASVPQRDRPLRPNTLVYTLLAFGVSLLIGVGGAFLGDHFDHTLRTTDQVERYLGLPVLGSVSRRGGGLIPESGS